MAKKAIKTKHLVLVGGGHSHLNVIKTLGTRPPKNTRITLISQDRFTPYSGMLPGLIAGHYQFSDAHIDLEKLCKRYGIDFIHQQVNHINLPHQQLNCNDRMTLGYDCLSLNIGSQPAINRIQGAKDSGIAVKPIANFLEHWQQKISEWSDELKNLDFKKPVKQPIKNRQIVIVGGGAASIEVAFACQYQLKKRLGKSAKAFRFGLCSANSELLIDASQSVQQFLSNKLQQRDIAIHLNHKVSDVVQITSGYELHFDEKASQVVDYIIWAIDATGPEWINKTGLRCDDKRCITVNRYLQSTSHSNVFAAGDIAHFSEQPLAKSGVYAVRAGETLSQNLANFMNEQDLIAFKPQQQFLKLLTTGDKYAVASKGQLFAKGKWVWHWKNWIDRQFMKQYQ